MISGTRSDSMRGMTDPYRSPGAVETREQRIERLRAAYYNMAAMNTPTAPTKRMAAIEELIKAREAWMFAAMSSSGIDFLKIDDAETPEQREAIESLLDLMTQHSGAGRGSP